MVKISTGKVNRPLRVVIDGVEGVGKTTLAAHFPDPLFIDLEQGTDSMDVRRTQTPQTWSELLQLLRDIVADPSVSKTLVIDTGDWAERLCEKFICWKYKVESIESIGYGKGWVYLREEFENLLRELDKVIAAGINVVIVCHVQIKKFELPDEQGSFDRYELKLSKNVAPLVREWCDIQLFANFKTYVIATDKSGTKHRASGGTKRVMYAQHSASWDAKNRHDLPFEMDFDFSCIAHLFGEKPAPEQKTPMEQLVELMERDGVSEAELQAVVADKGKYPIETPISEYDDAFISGWAIAHWDKILPLVEEKRA